MALGMVKNYDRMFEAAGCTKLVAALHFDGRKINIPFDYWLAFPCDESALKKSFLSFSQTHTAYYGASSLLMTISIYFGVNKTIRK